MNARLLFMILFASVAVTMLPACHHHHSHSSGYHSGHRYHSSHPYRHDNGRRYYKHCH